MMDIRVTDPNSPDALALLAAGQEAMQSLFPKKQKTGSSIAPLAGDRVTLAVSYQNRVPVGCCAVSIETDYSELKRLFVKPEARGLGAAALLVRYVEDVARAKRSKTIMLESGASLHAAHRLYLRLGYTQRAVFGTHEDLPESLFFEKRLAI